jgi:TolA-binding protein
MIDHELYGQALETLRDVTKADGYASAAQCAYLLTGSVHEKRGNRDDAIATYLEMATRFPTSPRAAEALFRMAEATQQSKRRGREKEVLELYGNIATRYKYTAWAPKALMAKGRIEEQQKLRQPDPITGASIPSAVVTYRDLASMHPASPEREHALWRLAQLYIGLKQYDLAADTLSDLAERYSASNYDAWFAAAEIYEKRLKKDTQARSAYAQVPPTSPRYADALKRLTRP